MTRFSHFNLNGQAFTEKELESFIDRRMEDQDLSDWESDLYLFLKEWITDSDHIQAQTSGSTGDPKSIGLSRELMLNSANRTIRYFGLKKGDSLLLSLPCRYIAGKMMVVRAIAGGMNLLTTDPSGNFDILLHQSVTFGAMVPNQIFKLLNEPSGIQKIQNIHTLLVGGSAISYDLEERLGNLPNRIVSTYGMTETASHIAVREISADIRSEFYECLDGVSVSVNQAGCLQICTDDIPEMLVTNDLAEIVSPRKFRITGRADNILISGGIKFSPETIEKKLEGLLDRPYLISSLPDKKLGERLVLIVEGDKFPVEELEEKMRKRLSSYEYPKQIIFIEKLPLTSLGKVKRKFDL